MGASELLDNLGAMFLQYYMHSNIFNFNMLNYSATHQHAKDKMEDKLSWKKTLIPNFVNHQKIFNVHKVVYEIKVAETDFNFDTIVEINTKSGTNFKIPFPLTVTFIIFV